MIADVLQEEGDLRAGARSMTHYVRLYHLYEECLHSISNSYAHGYTFEAKADLARAMAAGVFKRRWVMGQSMKVRVCDRQAGQA